MSTALDSKRAFTVIGISAAVACASFVLNWYLKRRPSVRPNLTKSSINKVKEEGSVAYRNGDIKTDRVTRNEGKEIEEQLESGTTGSDRESAVKIEVTTTKMMASRSNRDVGGGGRGGRRDYRHCPRSTDQAAVQMDGCFVLEQENENALTGPTLSLHQMETNGNDGGSHASSIFNDPAIVEASASIAKTPIQPQSYECARCIVDVEARGAKLAAEFDAKCQMASIGTTLSVKAITACDQHNANEESNCNCVVQQAPFPNMAATTDAPQSPLSPSKGHCAESPSLSSDFQSEGSQDSGKCTTLGLMSSTSMSPVEEIEIPAVYEFEVPQDIVGLLIGKQGTTIKWLTQQSQAHIVIRQHVYSDRHKICTLEGSREQINKCLRYIRRKFPPSRFPDLKLTPIILPHMPVSRTPVWDNVVQLNLPESVSCEIVVSSIVNGGHLFVQQPTHPTFPSLARLDSYMMAVYSQPFGVPALPRPIDGGVICAAPVLGGWYRAQTMETYDDTDEVMVKFVDYGGYSRIPAANLRQIRSDFMTLPFQATECYLAQVKPISETDGWSMEATILLEQLTLGNVLEAVVVGHANNNYPVLELQAPGQDSKPITINRLLVESGQAAWSN